VLVLDWSDEAQHDLADIQDYLGQRNPYAAQDIRRIIESGAERLTFIPLAFRAGRVAGTREYTVHPSYMLVYKVDSVKVRILRVMHTKRQYP